MTYSLMFIKTIITKILILIIIVSAVVCFMNASEAILNNYIALEQMEQSDVMFIIQQMYNNFLKPVLILVISLSTFLTCFQLVVDIYKFINLKKKEKTSR